MKQQSRTARLVSSPNFPELEEARLAEWRKKKIFQKTLDQTKAGPRFVFFEGPPTANGKPGIHHVLARVFKDIVCRYETMRGFFVERKAGWDTHGLPVELEVEKSLGLKSKKDIERYGIAKFNEQCRTNVWKYKKDWEDLTERIDFWLDLKHPYITYEPDYIESVWWILKQVWEKELLYQGYKVVPQCPRCGTALSSHEVAQGYKNITEDSVYLKFELVDEPGTFVLAWTTTPWTLPGNVALAVNPKLSYVKVLVYNPDSQNEEKWILEKDAWKRLSVKWGLLRREGGISASRELVRKLTIDRQPWDILEEKLGSELALENMKYKPLFDFLDLGKITKKSAYYITDADFVSTDEGTGVVHTAVMYGEEDYELGEKIGLPKHHTVTEDGHFTEDVKPWAGWFVKDKKTEQAIMSYLKEHDLLYKEEPYTHDYPFCWRCESPLLYYAKTSWFIKMSALRDQLLANNESITWVPEHIKHGRFGEWLAEVKDWAVSRERYWGTPLPIWICGSCKHSECLGSFGELRKRSKKKLAKDFDPHRPAVDEVVLTCPQCQGEMFRVKELCDVWFDSGSMPWAQWHYPFENSERIEKGLSYPANYIAEAVDQTRGWFYTLLAIGTLLGRGSPYLNVINLGHILDAKGQKMSKHIGNVVDPWTVIRQYGSDALRFHFFTINQPGETKLFDTKAVGEVVRKTFLLLWNVASFWELAHNEKSQKPTTAKHVLDRWILARLDQVVAATTQELERFQVTNAARGLTDFVQDLSTWYVRRSRDRIRNAGSEQQATFQTLKHCLLTLAKLFAPFTPLFSETLYQRLGGQLESVHLERWPEPEKEVDATILATMRSVRSIVEVGHRLREESGLKVRQPLSQLVVVGTNLPPEFLTVLEQELNVREAVVAKNVPSGMEWKPGSIGSIGVALDVTVTDELLHAGWIREVVRNVNDLRKQAGLLPQDEILLYYTADDDQVLGILRHYETTLASETRAKTITHARPTSLPHTKAFSLGKGKVFLAIE